MPPPPTYLFTGPEELLLRRAADDLVAQLRAEGPLELADLRASELGEDGLPDLRTGSLFGDRRVIVLREAEQLPAAAAARLVTELEGAPPDALVILLATGTARITKLAKRVKDLGGRFDLAPPREWDGRGWDALVRAEFSRHDRQATAAAVRALLSHSGLDVGTIAEKVAQVASMRWWWDTAAGARSRSPTRCANASRPARWSCCAECSSPVTTR
jgi:DNA polymerase-3 subunit delta